MYSVVSRRILLDSFNRTQEQRKPSANKDNPPTLLEHHERNAIDDMIERLTNQDRSGRNLAVAKEADFCCGIEKKSNILENTFHV